MRARKNPLPLTLDNVLCTLKPGRPYSVESIALMFGASPQAVDEIVSTALAAGTMNASRKVRGFRRTFWVPIAPDPLAATRRWQAGDMRGELVGYDLMRLPRLCMAVRR